MLENYKDKEPGIGLEEAEPEEDEDGDYFEETVGAGGSPAVMEKPAVKFLMQLLSDKDHIFVILIDAEGLKEPIKVSTEHILKFRFYNDLLYIETLGRIFLIEIARIFFVNAFKKGKDAKDKRGRWY